MFKKVKKGQIIFLTVSTLFNLILMIIFYVLSVKGTIHFDYYYLSAIIGAILLLLGWTIPNHFEFSYRKKTGEYKGPLPIEVKDKKFTYRFPFISAGIIALIISSIFSML